MWRKFAALLRSLFRRRRPIAAVPLTPPDRSAEVRELLACLRMAARAERCAAPNNVEARRDLFEILDTCARIATELQRSGDRLNAKKIRFAVYQLFGRPDTLDPPPYAALAMPVPPRYRKLKVHAS